MKIYIITLFPEMFHGVLGSSMMWKAQDKALVHYEIVDLRRFGIGPRLQVDDTPYGGGDGMLFKIEPMVAAIEYCQQQAGEAKVILPTPRGTLYKQSAAIYHASQPENLIFLCPRYEGYDERVTEWVDYQYCVGNYILTGGELPAMVIIDSIVRLIPGVLGGETSALNESFQADDVLIEHPQYTRPDSYRGRTVPDVLRSGHHGDINKWRISHSRKSG